MRNVSVIIFGDVPALEREDRDFVYSKVEGVLQELSKVVPDILERATNFNQTAASMSVMLSEEECVAIEEYQKNQKKQ